MEKPVVFFINEMKTTKTVKAHYLPCPPLGGSLLPRWQHTLSAS